MWLKKIEMAYTGRNADGLSFAGVSTSRRNTFWCALPDIGVVGAKPFSLSFWLKLNKLADWA